jgi:hypothetical protein
VDSAQSLGQDGGAFGGTTVQDLTRPVAEMSRALDLIRTIEGLPPVLTTLLAYKPKPGGALEKRLNLALPVVTQAVKSSERDQAEKFLTDLVTVAKMSDELARRPSSRIPAHIAQNYAGGRLDAFEQKWRQTISDVATQLSGGGGIDAGTLARLNVAASLYDGLTAAESLESALQRSGSLQRWVDWSVSADQLRKIFSPYRDGMLAGFDGFSRGDDRGKAMERWARLRPRYEPLIAYVKQVSSYSDQCDALPDGFPGTAARLMTKLSDDKSFGTERFASLAIGVWHRAERGGDFQSADAAAAALAERVGK